MKNPMAQVTRRTSCKKIGRLFRRFHQWLKEPRYSEKKGFRQKEVYLNTSYLYRSMRPASATNIVTRNKGSLSVAARGEPVQTPRRR